MSQIEEKEQSTQVTTPLICSACHEEFEAKDSIDGNHCFICSVHTQCACSDPSEDNI